MDAFFTSKFSLEEVDVVFFDVAGTLVETAEPVGAVYARVAGRHGTGLDPEVAEQRFRTAFRRMGRPDYSVEDAERAWWRALVAQVFETDPGDACFSELFNHYGKPEAWAVLPGVVAALERLSKSARLGVISNFDARLLPVLDGLGLARFFETVTYSGEVGAAKPDPAIFLAACAKMGVEPGRCLLVGDDPERDQAGAEGVGMRCVLVGRKPPTSGSVPTFN